MHWISPTFCELCHKKLIGVAEINSSVEADETITLTVKQSKVVDWVFCRSCRGVICRESCLDLRTGFCRACASEEPHSGSFATALLETAAQKEITDEILSADLIF